MWVISLMMIIVIMHPYIYVFFPFLLVAFMHVERIGVELLHLRLSGLFFIFPSSI